MSLDSETLLIASGKGRKSRLFYPNLPCLTALSEWIRERAKMGVEYDWFWAFDTRRRMGEPGTRQMLEETKARAGLADHKHIMPHTIRRAYATRCMAKGLDLRSLSASLGHAHPSTTLIYTFVSERPAEEMKHFADLRLDGQTKQIGRADESRSVGSAAPASSQSGANASRSDAIRRWRNPTTR